MNTTDIYLVHTPLHILFTLNLIQQDPAQSPALVFVLGDFPDSRAVEERVQQSLGNRHRVLHLPGSYLHTHQSVSAKVFRHVNGIRAFLKARHIYQTVAVKRLMVFNDTRSEIQAIIHDLRGREVERVLYIEDGLAAYYRSHQRRNPKSALLLRILYRGAEPIMTHGAYSGTDEAILLHPDFANQSLQKKPRTQMPRFVLNTEQIKLLINVFGGLPANVEDALMEFENGVLICLPNSDVFGAPRSMARWIDQIITQYGNQTAIYLKYHPRESKEHNLQLSINKRVFVIPRLIPAELICALAGSRLSAVYAEASSILVTSRWMNPDVEAYSANWSGVKLPSELMDLFSRLGIHSINR